MTSVKALAKGKRKRKWKPVSIDDSEFFSGDIEGFVSLEVLDSQETNDEGGWKIIKQGGEDFVKKTKPKKKKRKKDGKQPEESESGECQEKETNSRPEPEEVNNTSDEDDDNEWKYLGIHPSIGKRLTELGFNDPTVIQKEAIPLAIKSRMDIVGAAETGSGKTLAYGVPLLHRLLSSKMKREQDETNMEQSEKMGKKGGVSAYVLAPTRELALQVYKCLQDIAKVLSIKVACIVGGMSEEKQQRVLKSCPEVVVATPGRLWYLIDQGDSHLSNTSKLQCLVIDEADRMVQEGHYQELTYLLDRINNNSEKILAKMQKFVFSATLTYSSTIKKGKKNKKNNLDTLLKKVGLKEKCKIIDLTPKNVTVESLTESKLMCSVEDKDAYLYYFLKQYPNRTLVFVNTIDTLRRLSAILTLLKLSPLPLHAGMQQRQRLKNLDRFKSRADGLLLASDVAARGLDIQGVQHVIHYQIPKTSEVYVHRSGRTARIHNEGLSLLLISPEDLRTYEKIWKNLKKDNEPPDFPVDIECLSQVKKRLSLARSIDKEEHKFRKKKSSNDWFITNAKEAELEVDEDLLEDVGDYQEQKARKGKLDAKKEELDVLLDTPLNHSGFLGKYPTKYGKLQTAGLELDESSEKTEREALKDIKRKRKRGRK